MKSKALMGGLAGISILILSGCSSAQHTATQNGTTNPAAQSNVTSNVAATTTSAQTSNTSSTASSTNATASNTNANTTTSNTSTNTTANNTAGSTTAANNTTASSTGNGSTTSTSASTTASTAANSGSSSSTVSITTQTGTPQNAMASTIQTLLTNPANEPVDCSAMVEYVYNQSGINLPRTVSEQSTVGTRITSKNQLQYGDIVFFDLSTKPNTPTFDGIYVGNGQFVAKTTHGIMSIQLNSSYWGDKFLYGQHVK